MTIAFLASDSLSFLRSYSSFSRLLSIIVEGDNSRAAGGYFSARFCVAALSEGVASCAEA
jgi:hypothetical protein